MSTGATMEVVTDLLKIQRIQLLKIQKN